MQDEYDFSVRGEDELSLNEWREMQGLPVVPYHGSGCDQAPLIDAPFVALTEPEKQNAQFTEIVRAFKGYYKKKSQSNHRYKRIFFAMVMFILLMISVGFVVACVYLLRAAPPSGRPASPWRQGAR